MPQVFEQSLFLFFLAGRGSLLWYLRKKVWALELVAGNDGSGFNLNSHCTLYHLSINLTKDGYQEIDKV